MTIKVTTEQLNKIVADAIGEAVNEAVDKALKNIENLEVVDEEQPETDIPSQKPTSVKVGRFSDDQYREAIEVMAANRGHGSEPKVGIFWYNISQKQLFGIVSHKRSDYSKPNAGGGLVTCSEMHEDVWKKEFYKQKYHNGGKGPFVGEYQYKPRGRVFYSPADDQYIIAVGSWIEQHPEAIPLIMEEYDLPQQNTIVQQASHWDIGQTWR